MGGAGLLGKSRICKTQGLLEVGRLYESVCLQAISWGLWLERNHRLFEGRNRTFGQIIYDIKELMWKWCLLLGGLS